GQLKPVAADLGYRIEDDILVAVGYGKVVPSQLVQRFLPEEKLKERAEAARAEPSGAGGGGEAADGGGGNGFGGGTELARELVGRRSRTGVLIGGVDDVLVRFGRCCNPVPGDRIVGFITRNQGVTVHTVGCPRALATDPERRVDVAWDVRGDVKRPVTLRVLTADRPGLLADMSNIFS